MSAIGGFIVARLTDKFYGHLRVSIIVLYCLSAIFFYLFLLIVFEVIPPYKCLYWLCKLINFILMCIITGLVYVAISGGLTFENSATPLLFETAVELAYPCTEDLVGTFMVFWFNFIASIFLFLFIIPSECKLTFNSYRQHWIILCIVSDQWYTLNMLLF